MDGKRRTLALALALALAGSKASAQEPDGMPFALQDSIFVMDSTAVCTDSLTVEFPESMDFDVDSLMGMWFAKHYISYDEECLESSVNPKFSDTVYAERLSSLPTIVEMPYNYITRNSIDAYMGRNRKVIAFALAMLPIYEDLFVEALIKYNVPLELKYLPIVESALKPKAYSRAGAAGMWQFIYSTGRKYGLYVNSLVDDRYDIAKASDAAARHLRDLYDMFGDWSLAISAYNCGPGNVTKAITRSGGKHSFWDLYPYLPRETRGYLPAFIAVNYAMSFYKEHGICPMTSTIPPQTDTLHINHNLHVGQLIHYSGISQDEFNALNPQYLTEVIPGAYRTCVVTLPQQYITPLVQAGDSLYEYEKEKYFPKAKLAYIDDDMKNRITYVTHKIKSGETLGSIAIKYHTTVKNIKNWNNLKSDNIRAGKTLRIYNR
ncbi:MAG: transglycosylase SLT domain-containing protein [Bacteroidaceae bacterium]|nr:transglycosylase SLT domain-containing protein [Bacteroidaceae bacterium]